MATEMGLTLQKVQSIENIERKQIQYWIRKGTELAKKETINF